MATYVFSDVHGHLVPLLRALDDASPGCDDPIYVLGDMVDRGPDSVGVLKLCRSIEGATVLMGNHEQMMLDCLTGGGEGMDEDLAWYNWAINGGQETAAGLAELDEEELDELIGWVASLPLHARCRVRGRDYLLVHAGIRPGAAPAQVPEGADPLDALLAAQSDEDLLWIREEFWGRPTGLVDGRGEGPVVVAGHTPTLVVERLADCCDRSSMHGGLLRMVSLGACEATGGVADRLAIDCGAGSAPGSGRVMVLRLDDGEQFYQMIKPGE